MRKVVGLVLVVMYGVVHQKLLNYANASLPRSSFLADSHGLSFQVGLGVAPKTHLERSP